MKKEIKNYLKQNSGKILYRNTEGEPLVNQIYTITEKGLVDDRGILIKFKYLNLETDTDGSIKLIGEFKQ